MSESIKEITINAINVEVGKPSAPGSLLRVLGKVFALAVVIGATIGGGILYAPGNIGAFLPNAWLYVAVWLFGGINALFGATVFAELGAMIPLSGSPYPFARRALGGYAGILARDGTRACGQVGRSTRAAAFPTIYS